MPRVKSGHNTWDSFWLIAFDMVSPSKVEVIKHAIKQVIQEVGPSGDHKTSSSSDDNDDDEKHDRGLLSRLMSQLEKLESEPEELSSPAVSKTEITINGDSTNMNDNEGATNLSELKSRLKPATLYPPNLFRGYAIE
uniref:Uncharacterized protein n=1 Tax=Tanacetum cinerariifolium TaxID=118510 RepID=A0A699I1A4_TANCI|nr:hypothetical protein [Tanacetum cinerariifolium]